MIFHSLDFLFFFIVTVAVYWTLPRRAQNILLLVASYFFYGYVHPWFLILIATSTIVDYSAARGMEAIPGRRRLFLGLSIASNFGMLGFFKYFNFFVDNVHGVLTAFGLAASQPVLQIVLPVGISFYTFQEVAYLVDVYKRKIEPEVVVNQELIGGARITVGDNVIDGTVQEQLRAMTQQLRA